MLEIGFLRDANGLVGQAVSSPVAAAWFQAVGSLVTLLAASLIPWLRGRARQRAFLLRARILVQIAQINLKRIERSLDKTGELKDLHFELHGISDDFPKFPVEELSRNAATAFHECRIAALNVELAISRLKSNDGVLSPHSRMNILRLITRFNKAFKNSGKIFNRSDVTKKQIAKEEKTVLELLEARLPEFERQWREYKLTVKINETNATVPNKAPIAGTA